MTPLLQHIKKSIVRFVFAELCYFCREEYRVGEKLICSSCDERLNKICEPFCSICGVPFGNTDDTSHKCGKCIKQTRHYDIARSVFVYDDVIRNKIIEYKFMRNITLATPFSEYMLSYIEYQLSNGYDTIIPVPLHKKRLKERYFNQSALLVRGADRRNKGNVKNFVSPSKPKKAATAAPEPLIRNHLDGQITLDKYSLKRIKYTTPQVLLKGIERIKNVKGAFIVNNDYNVSEKRVLLIDDIYTTGSTVNECAKVLKKAGAKKVDVLTLAKVVNL